MFLNSVYLSTLFGPILQQPIHLIQQAHAFQIKKKIQPCWITPTYTGLYFLDTEQREPLFICICARAQTKLFVAIPASWLNNREFMSCYVLNNREFSYPRYVSLDDDDERHDIMIEAKQVGYDRGNSCTLQGKNKKCQHFRINMSKLLTRRLVLFFKQITYIISLN